MNKAWYKIMCHIPVASSFIVDKRMIYIIIAPSRKAIIQLRLKRLVNIWVNEQNKPLLRSEDNKITELKKKNMTIDTTFKQWLQNMKPGEISIRREEAFNVEHRITSFDFKCKIMQNFAKLVLRLNL